MSTDGIQEQFETTDSGFTLTKEILEKEGHIQVDIEVTSLHDDKGTVDVKESIPAGTDSSEVGFMPGGEPDEWEVDENGNVVFTSWLVPQGTREVTYGVKNVAPDEAETLTGEPRVVAVRGPAGENFEAETEPTAEPADGESGTTGDSRQEREQNESEADDDPTSEHETEPSTGSNEQAPDTSAGANQEPTEGPAAATDDGAAGEGSQAANPDGGEVTDATGNVKPPLSEETAQALARELKPHLQELGDTGAVVETKLTQLQEDVGDVRTYLPALEEFLGETGTADDIAETLERLEQRIDEMDDVPEELDDRLDDIDDRLASVEELAGNVDSELDAICDRLDALESWRDEIAAASSSE